MSAPCSVLVLHFKTGREVQIDAGDETAAREWVTAIAQVMHGLPPGRPRVLTIGTAAAIDASEVAAVFIIAPPAETPPLPVGSMESTIRAFFGSRGPR